MIIDCNDLIWNRNAFVVITTITITITIIAGAVDRMGECSQHKLAISNIIWGPSSINSGNNPPLHLHWEFQRTPGIVATLEGKKSTTQSENQLEPDLSKSNMEICNI